MNKSIERVSPVGRLAKRVSSPNWLPRWRSATGASAGAGEVHGQTDLLEPFSRVREKLKHRRVDNRSTRPLSSVDEIDSMQLLRAQLALKWFNGEARHSLSIVSPDGWDAGPSIAVRLATACAAAGNRTLLIDANLRSPTVSSILGVDSPLGLSSMLAGDVDLGQAISSTKVAGLSVLTSGPAAEPPEVLLSKVRLKRAIDEAERDFDVVLLDTPAMSAYADALIVADVVRGALVVVHRHQTRAVDLSQLGTELRSIGVAIVGAVFTDA